MQIFNNKNNEIISAVEELKTIQNEIKELVKERDKISVPPLSNLIISQREDILDDLIPILTGYYTIKDIEENRRINKQLFLDTIKQIGIFLINFSETSEQYKIIIKKIEDLKQKEYILKEKIGIE